MATAGAGGLSTAAIAHCLACWDDAAPLDAEIPAARAELAALRAAAQRAGVLAAALRHIVAYYAGASEDDLPFAVILAQRALEADVGPGAAGARDETRTQEDGYAAGREEGWRAGLKASEAAAGAARALLTWHRTPAGRPGVYEPDDGEGLCAELAGELDALDALRAGGAG